MLQNLSLAGFSTVDRTRQWAPPLGYKANMMRERLTKQWGDFKWHAPKVHMTLDTEMVTKGIVAGSSLVFLTVAMIAFMAVADLAHAQSMVHDEDLYNLSKPVEPSGDSGPIITPVMAQPHVVQVREDNRTITTVNESPAVITQNQGGTNPDIRVLIPSGEVITVANPVNGAWWRDPRVATYRSYYYDPEKSYYVIYDTSSTVKPDWAKWDKRWDDNGNPCKAGVKSC